MTRLTIEQLIYLLYAKAYTEVDTVTKGTVKSYLTQEWKSIAENIYDTLLQQELIKQTSKGRFSLTEQGLEALVIGLATTDYKFDSVKGAKVLNTLLACMQLSVNFHEQIVSSKEMSFDEFEEKFKKLYFEERRKQELRGVVAIHSQELCKQFEKMYPISENKIAQYFDLLKSEGKIFAVIEKGHELIQWGE